MSQRSNLVRGCFILPLVLLFCECVIHAQILDLPPRPADALSGSEFAKSITSLDATNREIKIYEQIARGNVPNFLRKLQAVSAVIVTNDRREEVTYYVTPDYLAVGSDADYFFTPLSPIMAQRIADLTHCILPTRKMVDEIYLAAPVKLVPSPIPPSAAMATVPIFIQHNSVVAEQRKALLDKHPLGELVAGDKKDVVISKRLATNPSKVAIYGWHKSDGKPIQPLYTGHADYYADYSHGIRLVQLALTVNGKPGTVPQVLANPDLSPLLSDEGPFTSVAYPAMSPAKTVSPHESGSDKAALEITRPGSLPGFQTAPFDEQTLSYTNDSEVKITINAPTEMLPNKMLKLIFFALPNGNTTAQAIGKELKPGDDWHYNIQHIGAQTRYLRQLMPDTTIIVVYLEAFQRSWPAWRKAHSDHPELIPQLIDSIKNRFKDYFVEVTLSGHSGGGSLIFGYINTQDKIPNDIERIAFLDSNYAYDEKLNHAQKMLDWLRVSDKHYLSVLAYNDAVALLDGKTFVSTNGGTWGRSHAMLKDFAGLNFTSQTNGDIEIYKALNGRVEFLLKENPEKKIYHTIQVEKNGFIQSMVSGTPLEGRGYTYFGDRVYTNWIAH